MIRNAPTPKAGRPGRAHRPGSPVSFLVSIAVLAAAFCGPHARATVTGRVFLDDNENGTYDEGEAGVADCIVSDERLLARTAGDGRYRLDVGEGPAVIFVVNKPGTWPAGPWWAYLPAGEGGAAPRATCDFALAEQDQPSGFYFAQGTDMHIRPDQMGKYDNYVRHINNLPVLPAFVLHTGDLVIDANRSTPAQGRDLFSLYQEHTALLKPPVRHVCGNHEHVGCLNDAVPEDDASFGKRLYREVFGPTTYAFRYGRAHFVGLDGTTLEGRKLSYGLTTESVTWAEQYLATVAEDEPVVLFIHEPVGGGLAGRLAEAAKGKKLVATLCGHGHERGWWPWGGGVQIMGGAVSYAWHGLLPFPPNPYGYVVYHLDGLELEWIFLDWAEERSFDVSQPGPAAVAAGLQALKGLVSDLTGDIRSIEVSVSEASIEVPATRRGVLAQAFDTQIDLSSLPDAFYDMRLVARGEAGRWQEVRPLLVVNGKPAAFEPAGPARLRFRVEGIAGGGNAVLINGREVLTIAADMPAGEEISTDVPAEHLRRLNAVTFRPAQRDEGYDKMQVWGVALDYGGDSYRDLRYAPSMRLAPRVEKEGQAAERTFYVDLVYDGPRPE